MTLLFPRYVEASNYDAMDETAEWAAKQAEPKQEEKGGEACPA